MFTIENKRGSGKLNKFNKTKMTVFCETNYIPHVAFAEDNTKQK